MTFTLGRVTLDDSCAIDVYELTGNRVRVQGDFAGASLDHTKAMRQGVAGYAGNSDEPWISGTWDQDSSFDGYFSVVPGSIPTRSLTGNGLMRWSVDLDRVPGYAMPMLESRLLGALRVNSHSVTSASAYALHGVPRAAVDVSGYYATNVVESGTVRVTDTGEVIAFVCQTNASPSYTDDTPQWICPPARYYDGACVIEAGSTRRVIVGEQLPLSAIDNWRIGNGLVRVSFANSATDSLNTLNVETFDGSVWDTAKAWQLTFKTGVPTNYAGPVRAVTVIRNSPEQCILRVVLGSLTGDIPILLDISVRRGARLAEFYSDSAVPTGSGWAVGTRSLVLTTGEATSDMVAGGRATSNDASGNRYIYSSPTASASVTTAGDLLQHYFALGAEVGGTSATGNDTAQNLIYQYLTSITETVRVVGR